MNISQIIAVVGFLVIVIIIITLLLKKFREERAEEKKERKLRGESEEEKDEKKVSRGSKPLLNFFKNIQSILLPMCIYITILISFSILLPDLWRKYWDNQEFFWVSQAYLGTMIVLRYVGISSIRWVLRIVFSIIIITYLYGKMPETTEEMTKTSAVYSLTQGEVYGNRLATIGPEWSQEFVIPKKGGVMRIKRVDPSIPLECLVTLIDDNKKIFKIPGVGEGYGDFNLPDSEGLKIRTTYPTTTTVWIIIKPL